MTSFYGSLRIRPHMFRKYLVILIVHLISHPFRVRIPRGFPLQLLKLIFRGGVATDVPESTEEICRDNVAIREATQRSTSDNSSGAVNTRILNLTEPTEVEVEQPTDSLSKQPITTPTSKIPQGTSHADIQEFHSSSSVSSPSDDDEEDPDYCPPIEEDKTEEGNREASTTNDISMTAQSPVSERQDQTILQPGPETYHTY